MNIRLQKYKKNRIAGMNQHNAARAAGYSERYAKVACRIEKSVKVSLADEFERQGLTDKAIVIHSLGGLSAIKVQGCNVYVYKDEDGKWKVNEAKNDFIEHPDWNARHKYLETILKLTERLKDKWEQVGGDTRIIIIRDGNKAQNISRGISVLRSEIPSTDSGSGNGKDIVPSA